MDKVIAYKLVAIHGLERSREILANAPSDAECFSWTLGDSGVRDKTVNLAELADAVNYVDGLLGSPAENDSGGAE